LINRAFIAGHISEENYAVTWTPPKFEMVDPLKDAQADTMMIRNGTLTQKEAIARQGYDPDEQFQEIARINKLLDDLGIVLDSDPRKTAKSGMVQTDIGGDTNAKSPTEGQ
jgi:capsid protein